MTKNNKYITKYYKQKMLIRDRYTYIQNKLVKYDDATINRFLMN